MDTFGAIVFLSQDDESSSLWFSDILFDPAALWLSEFLRSTGVERFFVLCSQADRPQAEACFPEGTVFAAPGAPDLSARVADFLEGLPGGVVAITQPVLLAPQGVMFSLPGKETSKSVFTLRASVLASAIRGGKAPDEAIPALGETASWQGRVLPLKADPVYRSATVDPLAKGLGVERLLHAGVRVVDGSNTYVGPAAAVGVGSVLLPGTILRGRTVIGKDCTIGPNTMIRDCVIGDNVSVNSSQLNESVVDSDTTVGPFAYIRPHCHVGQGVKVGDFVELKNSTIGDGTKISHLTYVGDSDVGSKVNFGCGTVTVNYDGTKKFRTVIGDHAFIGCNTNLVAPVEVGEGAYTAAGSTITEDVPALSLAIARSRQEVKKDWVKRRRR